MFISPARNVKAHQDVGKTSVPLFSLDAMPKEMSAVCLDCCRRRSSSLTDRSDSGRSVWFLKEITINSLTILLRAAESWGKCSRFGIFVASVSGDDFPWNNIDFYILSLGVITAIYSLGQALPPSWWYFPPLSCTGQITEPDADIGRSLLGTSWDEQAEALWFPSGYFLPSITSE